MLAKAGEGDRTIKTKMVKFLEMYLVGGVKLMMLLYSQNICSLANARVERPRDDRLFLSVLHAYVSTYSAVVHRVYMKGL